MPAFIAMGQTVEGAGEIATLKAFHTVGFLGTDHGPFLIVDPRGSMLMFGGGIKKGFVYGRTADERPCTTIEKPMPVEDLHATIYHALGIPPDAAYVAEERPVYVTKDGIGKPANELFA